MAFNSFCKVDGAEGECSQKGHDKYFEILSFYHAIRQTGSGSSSGSGGLVGGRAELSEFSVTKRLDKASPKLAFLAANGKAVKEVLIECHHDTGEKARFLEIKLTKAVVRSVRLSGGGDDRPHEVVAFGYSKIEWTYTEYDNDQKKKGDVKANWDLEKHTGS